MIPLLPFFAGVVVGAAALSALRSERTRTALNQTGARLRTAASEAESGVRAAAQSGLALLRGTVTETPTRAKSAVKRSTKKPAAEKPVAPAAPKRAPRKPKAPEAKA